MKAIGDSLQDLRTHILIVAILATIIIVFVIDDEDHVTKNAPRLAQAGLTQELAQERAQLVTNVHYALDLDVRAHDLFRGDIRIRFDLQKEQRKPLSIDFADGDIELVEVNGKAYEHGYQQWFVEFPAKTFKIKDNTIRVVYSRAYDINGEGLHRFTDSTTNNSYLYSNFEPYNANRVFPHFDQPDIKAHYTLSVLAPSSWQVISATRETLIENKADARLWHFPESPKISSYIFPVHAGPFHIWESQHQDIPLRLFARQEIKEFVKVDDWFNQTKQSFSFFNQYFEFFYPFKKYDQIIVPEFNAGAMENLAAVTFSERFVSRGEKTEKSKRTLAMVIAHEMAHMWFGNIVTMQWWDDLWLNESFATYMSYLALENSGDHPQAWDDFYVGMKQWAYRTDQQVTTHPIELGVDDTRDALTNFDGITYGKGASVLKQLPFHIGAKEFRQGVVNYIKDNAYGNARLTDFVQALGLAANQDLSQWQTEWLQSAGLNTLQVDFACDDKQLQYLNLNQRANPSWPTLRSQTTQIALFNHSVNGLALSKTIELHYSGQKTPVEFSGSIPCPDFVFPNYDDWAYAKVQLDEKSLDTLTHSINDFSNEGLRLALWQSLWDSVTDAEMPINDYIDFAILNLGTETSDRVRRQVNQNMLESFNLLYAFENPKRYTATQTRIHQFFRQTFIHAEAFSDTKRMYLSAYIETATGATTEIKTLEATETKTLETTETTETTETIITSQQSLKALRALLDSSKENLGLQIDQDLRWQIIARLNRYQYDDYMALLSKESKLDPSNRGEKSALKAEAQRPVDRTKRMWLLTLLQDDHMMNFSEKRAALSVLFKGEQHATLKPYANEILVALETISQESEDRYQTAFTHNLAPAFCSQSSVKHLDEALKDSTKFSAAVTKELRIAQQEDQRCVDIKKQWRQD
ncbi:MAG: aminopeptidase N [Flavobacteriales bacterium]|jgi:aminopeptidase N